ncbi:MAG: GNAT family N-acetyltransferase [Caldilineaceae bacterium]|nr:GNAT family N-acetyltransferase [Caldilineaceae bacterium]
MHIRPFHNTEEECTGLIELRKILEPERVLTIALLREQYAELENWGNIVGRYIGEVDGQIVASGSHWHSAKSPARTANFALQVRPDHQNGPLPAQMQDYLLSALRPYQPPAFASEPHEGEVYRVQLLERAGFEPIMRFPRSQVDVTTFDNAAYAHLPDHLRTQHIDIVTLTDIMQSDPAWRKNVWRMFTRIEQDVPAPDPAATTSFEQYSQYYDEPLFRPDSWAIAVDTQQVGAERYVGMCVVNLMPTRPDTLFAGITGVIPSYRRRKIATALKVKSIQYAQKTGHRYIYTNNEENNPMLDLNLALGFQPLPAWVYYKKQL